MNPNSRNQRWSKWTMTITGQGVRRPTFQEIRANTARFGLKAFGSASTMRITQHSDRMVQIEALTEGPLVHDPAYVEQMRRQWERWAVNGFGLGTSVTLTAKLMAGTREDGSPCDQLIIGSFVLGTPKAF